MEKTPLRISVMIVIALGLFMPRAAQAASAQAASAQAAGGANAETSPAGFLNPDGTLKLDGSFSGALSLSGWNVRIDPSRGPVFGPQNGGQASPDLTAAPGDWADLGGGGGGALNDNVWAVALLGSDVIVGGFFTNADNITEADYIAKWNSTTGWSALGSNGSGEGSLNSAAMALAVDGTTLYAGGYFTSVNDGGVYRPQAARVAKWDGSHWTALGDNGAGGPSIDNGWVRALAVGPSHELYVSGYFTDVKNGSTTLTAADYIAKWDGSSWSALGSNGSGNGSLNDWAYALAIHGTDLYVGGNFTDVKHGGVTLPAADYIARWDTTGASGWSAVGNNGAGDGSLNNWVDALAVSGSDLYVGGNFYNVNHGSTPLPAADLIAKWDMTGVSGWSALGSNGAGGGSLNNIVYAILAVDSSHVYVGGSFKNVNNGGTVLGAADYIAMWDGANWSALGSNGAGDGCLSDEVYALAYDGSHLYVGGKFLGINNSGTNMSYARDIGRWDGATGWSAMGAAQGSLNGRVRALAVSGTDVYVGGDFRDVGDNGVTIPAADYIARWDGSHWHALGSGYYGNGSLNGPVYAIGVSDSNVYVGGGFTDANNGGTPVPAADYVARWDGTNWSALGSDGSGNGSIHNYVYALAVSGSDVYTAGSFYDVVDATYGTLTAADYVAKWDGSRWSALGSTVSGGGSIPAGTDLHAVAVMDGKVYAGGNMFYVVDGTNTLAAGANLAAYDIATGHWSAVRGNGSGGPSLTDTVYALAARGSNLYVGGLFTNVKNGGTTLNAADYIAKWDGTDWSALGSNGSSNGSLNDDVYAIAVLGTHVYAGGYFHDVVDATNGTLDAADYVAKWDGTNWSALGSDASGTSGNGSIPYVDRIPDVIALAASASDVYVGGAFYNVNNHGTVLPYADNVAAYGEANPSFHISGNAGVGGATLAYYGGSAAADATTGDYSFLIPYGWSGTVMASKTGYTFAPAHIDYDSLIADQTGQNYTATPLTAPVPRIYPSSGDAACPRPQVGADLMLTDLMRKNGSFDPSTITLKLDGIDVSGSAQSLQTMDYPASIGSVLFTPPSDLALGPHEVVLTYPSGTGTVTMIWDFTAASIACPTGGGHSPQLEGAPSSESTDTPDGDFSGIQAP